MRAKRTDPHRFEALELVAGAAQRVTDAEGERNAAMLSAHEFGISYRDIADAAGMSHQTVKNTLARLTAHD